MTVSSSFFSIRTSYASTIPSATYDVVPVLDPDDDQNRAPAPTRAPQKTRLNFQIYDDNVSALLPKLEEIFLFYGAQQDPEEIFYNSTENRQYTSDEIVNIYNFVVRLNYIIPS